jgi:glycosyltransferase involved in cell wall biosynthesis
MAESCDLAVIIPTFNEEENIAAMIGAVEGAFRESGIRGEILVMDDGSTDRTIPIVREIAGKTDNVRLIVRKADHGLSQSVVEGFRSARSDILLVIDADFSHPPKLIPLLYEAIRGGADIAIGSRYMEGGDIEAWPLKRRIISRSATAFGRILFPGVTDPVSGFFAVRREVVAGAPLAPRGYKILMEVLGRGRWQTLTEIPFVFKDREGGESKLRADTVIDYLRQCGGIVRFPDRGCRPLLSYLRRYRDRTLDREQLRLKRRLDVSVRERPEGRAEGFAVRIVSGGLDGRTRRQPGRPLPPCGRSPGLLPRCKPCRDTGRVCLELYGEQALHVEEGVKQCAGFTRSRPG